MFLIAQKNMAKEAHKIPVVGDFSVPRLNWTFVRCGFGRPKQVFFQSKPLTMMYKHVTEHTVQI